MLSASVADGAGSPSLEGGGSCRVLSVSGVGSGGPCVLLHKDRGATAATGSTSAEGAKSNGGACICGSGCAPGCAAPRCAGEMVGSELIDNTISSFGGDEPQQLRH